MEMDTMFHDSVDGNITATVDSARVNALLCIVIPISLIALMCAIFNIFSVYIIVNSTKLHRPSNFPVISVLIGATLQSLLSVPTFIFKRVNEVYSHQAAPWFCEFYLVPYFFCGHIMKMSLLIVSVDRLVAVKHPYGYSKIITKRLMVILLVITWFIVLVIDMIPFFPANRIGVDRNCKYISDKVWRMINFLLFDALTFFTITANYVIIWKAAIDIAHQDANLKNRIHGEKAKVRNDEDLCSNERNEINAIEEEEEDGNSPDSEPNEQHSMIGGSDKKNDRVKKSGRTLKKRLSNESAEFNKRFSIASNLIRYTWDMKATKTSALLLLVYLVSWGPLDILYAIDIFFKKSEMLKTNVPKAYFAAKIMSFFSGIFMPLVYCWRTKEFVRETLRLMCRERYRKQWAKSFFQEARATVIAQYSALAIDRKSKYQHMK